MIVDIEKSPSMRSYVIGLDIGEEKPFSYSKRHSIRPMISKLQHEFEYRLRVYETREDLFEGIMVLFVKRLEDKKEEL